MRKIATLGLLVLLAVLAMPTASAYVTMYFDPQDSSVPGGYCNTTHVKVMANITSPDDLWMGQFAIYHSESCANITDLQWGPNIYTMMSSWNAGTDCVGTDYDWIKFTLYPVQTGGDVEICNLTIHCSSCEYCISPLNFSCGRLGCAPYCPIQVIDSGNNNLYPASATLVNGNVECGTSPSTETFSKSLYEGWNLISLPLAPENNSVSMVLSTVSYDAVYRYDATLKQFETADVMNPGTGYFVHVTDCTWKYNGTACTSMDMSLEPGLNIVGWMNCTKGIDNALSSISGKYHYAARWNTIAQKFEVHNPAAPSAFNDFTTMDRGTGYFISAKEDCVLSESC
jgi:hypothetical protein